jgi:GNAT superfamily N-acetyltransferase
MQVESLRDGTTVTLRPLAADDLERSRRFFAALPEADRRYLRFDVTRRAVVERLIEESVAGRAYRLVAVVDDEIVGHGALEFDTGSWRRHIGEIRVIVAEAYRGRHLGSVLIRHLFREAERVGATKLMIRLAEPQRAARMTCERLGFCIDAVLPDHVVDAEGKHHSLIVMSCALDEMARSLRESYKQDDWPDG